MQLRFFLALFIAAFLGSSLCAQAPQAAIPAPPIARPLSLVEKAALDGVVADELKDKAEGENLGLRLRLWIDEQQQRAQEREKTWHAIEAALGKDCTVKPVQGEPKYQVSCPAPPDDANPPAAEGKRPE